MRLFETLILFGFIWATTLGSKQPHIILMVADDLGNFPKKCNWCLPILRKTLVVHMYVKSCFKIFIAQNNNRF